jgi:AcrR family transcriptional regulator
MVSVGQGIKNRMIQKAERSRGRPRHFDENEAIARAIRVFWAKGYDGVTIDDLVEGMGVGRPSLYAVFGDKQALFLRCLEEYGLRTGSLALKALNDPLRIGDAFRAFLSFAVQNATAEDSPLGCLIVCVAPLVDDPRVRDYLVRAGTQTVEAVTRRLRAGIEAGELPQSFPAARRARLAVDVSRGLAVRARIGTSRKELLRDATEAATLLTTA